MLIISKLPPINRYNTSKNNDTNNSKIRDFVPDRVTFTSNERLIFSKSNPEKVVMRNTTQIFRDDILSWPKFGAFLINRFINVKKPHIYCYACSDGSEPYSLALVLKYVLKDKNADKFFPIIAKDIDPDMIKSAQNGVINLGHSDFNKLSSMGVSDLFHKVDINDPRQQLTIYQNDVQDGVSQYAVSDKLRKTVIFSKADIFKDIKNIEPENSVIMFRNVWYTFSKKKQEKLAKMLYEHLKPGSLIVVGLDDVYGDLGNSIWDVMEKQGFKHVKLDAVGNRMFER